MQRLRILVGQILRKFGYSVRNTPDLQLADAGLRSLKLLRVLSESSSTFKLPLGEAIQIMDKSKSQLGQDVVALSMVGTFKTGYFVEFGATNGLDLSNTYLLEKSFGWTGILCEPAPTWHADLENNRSCKIDKRCVFSVSSQRLSFTEGSVRELSGISSFADNDKRISKDRRATTYDVDTVSLRDLLKSHGAPAYIDFISIDTEGSEYEILRDFDFGEYSFGFVCVEHNYTSNREKLNHLLSMNGYYQVHPDLSLWDDWYVGPQLP
jgi:FkbM family methyltransferase